MKPSQTPSTKRRPFLFWAVVSLPLWVLGIMLSVSMYLGESVFATGTDLYVYRKAADFLATGMNPYDAATFNVGDLRWQYPPFALFLVAPLTLLHPDLLFGFWSLSAIALPLICVIGVLVRRILGPVKKGVQAKAGRSLLVLSLSLVAASASAVLNGWHLGQIGLLLTALIVVDLLAPREWLQVGRWTLPRGIGVGLATAIKLTPAIFIIHFLVTRQWRLAINAILTVIASWTAAFVVFPAYSVAFWFQGGLFRAATENEPSRLVQVDNISAAGAFDRIRISLGANLDALTSAPRLAVLAVLAILGLAAAAYLHRQGRTILAILTVGLTATLVSPVAWLHHATWFALLAPTFFLLALVVHRKAQDPGPLYVLGAAFFAVVALPSQIILTRFLQPEPINGLYFTAALILSIAVLAGAGRISGTADPKG